MTVPVHPRRASSTTRPSDELEFCHFALQPISTIHRFASSRVAQKQNFSRNANIGVEVTKVFAVNCDALNQTCFAFTGVSASEKAVTVCGFSLLWGEISAARGATDPQILIEIIDTFQ